MRFDFRHDADHVSLFGPTNRPRAAQASAPRIRQRHPSLQVLHDVLVLAGEHAELICHAERPWASATFAGARHSFTILFNGAVGAEAADTFMAALPDHEFAIRGQLVADAAVTEVTHVMTPTERVVIEADLLLLEDC